MVRNPQVKVSLNTEGSKSDLELDKKPVCLRFFDLQKGEVAVGNNQKEGRGKGSNVFKEEENSMHTSNANNSKVSSVSFDDKMEHQAKPTDGNDKF